MERNKSAMWELLQTWDSALFRLINETWAVPGLDGVLSLVGDFHLMKWPLILAALAALFCGGFRVRLFLFSMALALLVGDGLVSSSMKKAINRPRPYQNLEDVRHISREGWSYRVEIVGKQPFQKGRSMPSSHVCNNVALAFFSMLLFVPGRWVWVWAFLMAYSRVYTGDHYPSDVAVSFIVALAYSAGICCVVQFLWQQWAPRFFPETYAKYPRLYKKPS